MRPPSVGIESIDDFAVASARLADPFCDRRTILESLGISEETWTEKVRVFREKLETAKDDLAFVERYRRAFESERGGARRANEASVPPQALPSSTPEPSGPSPEPARPVDVPSYMLQSAPPTTPQPSYLAVAAASLPEVPRALHASPPLPASDPLNTLSPADPIGNETAMLPRNDEVLRRIAEAQPAAAMARAAATKPVSPPPQPAPRKLAAVLTETTALPNPEELLRRIAEADPRTAMERAQAARSTDDPVGSGTAIGDVRDAVRAARALPFREGEPADVPAPRPVPERVPTGTEGITPEQIAAALEAARRPKIAVPQEPPIAEPPLGWPLESYARLCVDVNMRPRDEVLREYGISQAERVGLDAYWQKRTADPAVRDRWLRACEHYRRGRYGGA